MPEPTPAPAAGRETIHALFEAAAAAHPDAVAVRHAGAELSYAALNARANRIAHALRAGGVGPEVPVAVFLPRTPELVAGLLGVLKAGGAYVPVDPAYPPARTAAILEDVGAPLVLTHSSVAAGLPQGTRAAALDALAGELAAQPETSPAPRAGPENLAYVIHTSGSTGRPKGVAIEHRNTLPVLRWWREAVSAEDRGRVLGSTSVCFDVSIAEIFGTLSWGGTLVLVEDALAVAGLSEEVRLACMVPSAAAELVRMGAIPASVRTLALGGEPVPPTLAREIFRRTGVRRVLNLYGPTEDTTYSTCAELEAEQAAPVPVGLPVTGGAVHVLDAALRPLADGAEGELYMAGAGVTRGYLGRPALTAERYLPDPLATGPGARMYRSGDLGRRRRDGLLECFGRTDHQVKVRGFRVEPGEVEAALLEHPDVLAVAVSAHGEPGARFLAAHVVGAVPEERLREWLGERLPEYMIPTRWAFLDALPRTPNGKVDRLALAEPMPPAATRPRLPPRTPVEEVLAGIWREVLEVEAVGVRDDFYALGGHSLRATRIAARIRRAFEVDLPLPVVFQTPTVEGQAREVERRLGNRSAAEGAIPRADRSRPLPLSAAQEAVWFFERLSPGMRSYQFQASVALRGTLDRGALERSLGEIVHRHEIFRTTFPELDGRPAQRIHPPWKVSLPLVEVGGAPGAEQDERLRNAFEAEFARPFDPERLPLVRWTLFRLQADHHVLLCVEHHLVHDGWSFGVFLRELVALYGAFAGGRPAPLAPPAVQFADYAVWQREWLGTGEARRHLDFWRSRLQGAPPALELPADRPRPPRVSFAGASLHVRLPTGLAHAADAFSRRSGVTLYMTLLAAFQALLHRYTGQAEFVIGGGTAARGRRDLEDTIGMLVNVIPLRADVRGDPGFAALVERVRAAALEEYANQDVPFSAIVEAVQPERTLDRNPVFQVAFNAHHAPYPDLHLPGLELEVTEALGNHTAKFDLQVIAIPRAQQSASAADETVLVWEYSTDLFLPGTVERMARHYERLLAALLAEPERALSTHRLLDEDERRVLEAWGHAPGVHPREETVHGAFARAAAADPGALALEWAGRRLTYAALDRASASVAARLRGLGIGAEDRVGIHAERGPEMVVAMLGALRAGAAYVPLAPENPAARLRWMAGDAGIRALLVPGGRGVGYFAGPVLGVALEAGEAHAETGRAGDPESLACVVYTSGTTGTPKGIGIPHRALVRLALGAPYAPLGAGDRVAQTANPGFDAVLWEVWGALLNGATLVGLDPSEVVDPGRLAVRLREERITSLFLTTVLFHQTAREAPEALSGLRHVIFGGETADPEAVRRVLGAGGPERLLHAYGPAEGTTYSSVHRVESLDPGAASVPIGRPVPGTRLHVLDPRGEPVPPGVVGELHVGGDGLARGYLERPGLTAERFLPDPFGEAGGRLYRTGDRARWTAEGVLEFAGRADAQVKVRGFRVEPAEVEAALRAIPGVADAAVVARPAAGGGCHLAGYVVTRGGVLDPAALRARLAERLPPYMMPSPLVVLPALPLGPNGKVDRAALPPPQAVAGPPADVLDGDQQAVAAIWREMLEVPVLSAGDDFFALGGHSLLAARTAARVGAAFGVDLPVAALFQHPTVRALASHAGALRQELLEARLSWLEGLSEEEAEALLREDADAVLRPRERPTHVPTPPTR